MRGRLGDELIRLSWPSMIAGLFDVETASRHLSFFVILDLYG